MYRAIVTVQRHGELVSHDLEVPAEIRASELAAKIASAMGWDTSRADRQVTFEIEALPLGRRLEDHETLASADAWDGSWLVLHPVSVDSRGPTPTGAPGAEARPGHGRPGDPTIGDAPDSRSPAPAREHASDIADVDTVPTGRSDGPRPASNPLPARSPFEETYLVLPERFPDFPSGLVRNRNTPISPHPEPPNVTTSAVPAGAPPVPPAGPPPVELPAAPHRTTQLPPIKPSPATPLPEPPSSPLVGWRRVLPDAPVEDTQSAADEPPPVRPGGDGPLRGWNQLRASRGQRAAGPDAELEAPSDVNGQAGASREHTSADESDRRSP